MNTDHPDVVDLLERICAASIATNAALKCMIAGQQLTTDNVIGFVGDYFDPAAGHLAGVLDQIERAIDDVVAVRISLAQRERPAPANENRACR